MMITMYLLILLVLVAVPSFILSSMVYSQTNVTNSDGPKFLAIQHAQSGSISEVNATTHSLELSGVSDKTILFSDRPDRIVASVSTDNFIGNWSAVSDNFVVDPPNAVLVVDDIEGENDIIIELLNPLYDADKRTLNYEIETLATISTSIKKFEMCTLIIDASIGIGMSHAGTL